MKRFLVTLFGVLFLVASMLRCTRKPDPLPDPCQKNPVADAAFTIREVLGDTLIETDLAVQYNTLEFRATEEADSYDWKFKYSDQHYSTRSFRLRFNGALEEELTLVVRRKPNLLCDPLDDGVDTLRKTFRVIPRVDAPIFGTYVGSFASTPAVKDTVWITVKVDASNPYPMGRADMLNINKGCGFITYPNLDPSIKRRTDFDSFDVGGKAIRFSNSSAGGFGCKGQRGTVLLSSDRNAIEVNFSYYNLDKPQLLNGQFLMIKDRFMGRKL